MSVARVRRINGALVEAAPMADPALYELVRVGHRRLLGEVVRLDGANATVQVFEETMGLALHEPVETTGAPLEALLGPGLLGSVVDGVGRPLRDLAARTGHHITPGAEAAAIDLERRWAFEASLEPGAQVTGGDVLGVVREQPALDHLVMVPPGVQGVLTEIRSGDLTVCEPLGRLEDGTALTLAQRWPVRSPRPLVSRAPSSRPLVTGQRVFDFLFPVAEGGTVAVPGGFGTGKTVVEQSLAKLAAADIVIYVACGERGNEVAALLDEFPRLIDPRTGRSIMERTIMIVNTSNMPVAARDASVHLGMTTAEFYRDMGYRVAVLADSMSRWAEALRELAARQGDMPGEEGYPTYLASQLGKLYERAGYGRALGAPERSGAVTFISAISPPGADFSEPVTQASLRVVGALWALDADLAHRRQFPAVDWETSYSLYEESTATWFAEHGGPTWAANRSATLELLQRERELREIAGLIGPGALEDRDRLIMETARVVREVVIGQSAYDPNDAFSSVEKTHRLTTMALALHDRAVAALDRGVAFDEMDFSLARRAIAALRSSPADLLEVRTGEAQDAITQAIDRRGQQ